MSQRWLMQPADPAGIFGWFSRPPIGARRIRRCDHQGRPVTVAGGALPRCRNLLHMQIDYTFKAIGWLARLRPPLCRTWPSRSGGLPGRWVRNARTRIDYTGGEHI